MEINRNLSDKAIEDFEWVRRAVEENEQQAYTELLGKYRDTVFHAMMKMVRRRDDAEDLTMEAFAKAFAKLHTYAPTHAFSTWLFRIATNNAIDFIRKQRLDLLSIDDGNPQADNARDQMSQIQSEALDPEERFISQQRQSQLRELLFRLSDKYRNMIELRYFEELSYQEISERLTMPVGTVKAQLFRAKEMLLDIFNTNRITPP